MRDSEPAPKGGVKVAERLRTIFFSVVVGGPLGLGVIFLLFHLLGWENRGPMTGAVTALVTLTLGQLLHLYLETKRARDKGRG